MLTEETRQNYIKHAFATCPFCGSQDIVGGSVEIDGNSASQDVSCSNCISEWRDVFTLTDIEEIRDGRPPFDLEPIKLGLREHATVLAALRLWQANHDSVDEGDLMEIATNGGAFNRLTEAEIDDLCQKLNLGSK